MSWVAVGVSLVGAVASDRQGRRGASAARRTAREARDRVSPFLLDTGYNVGVNNTNGGNSPSFTFGGNNGSVAPVLNPNGVANNPIDPEIAAQAGNNFSQQGNFFVDNNTGRYYDNTGKPIAGTVVQPGSSLLDIAIPDFSDAINFSLSEQNAKLQDLQNEFSVDQENPGQLLELANQAGELLPAVKEGASTLRESRLNQINDGERQTISDLRENMAQRRISGSSFADDSLSRSQAEFSRARSDVEARATLEEISATSQILGFQAQVIERSGQIVLSALQQESNNRIAEAQIRLQGNQAQFAAEAQALTLAFQGQQQAQNYVQNLLQIANGATELQLGAIEFGTEQAIQGINGITSAGINSVAAVEQNRGTGRG